MGHHIDEAGRFQSDKYPDLPPDRIRVSFQNPRSERALRVLAQDYEDADAELAADVNQRLDALYGALKPGDYVDIANLAPLERLPAGVGRFRKRPVAIEAIQWTGHNWSDVLAFVTAGNGRIERTELLELRVMTLEGSWVRVSCGAWVIQGVQGEFYPCAHTVFERTYEVAGDPGGLTGEEKEMVAAGRSLHAIRSIRERTGYSLADAKKFLDRHR